MTVQEYVDDIKISLGAPIVEVEIEELLVKIVDKAFREVKRYITETHFTTIPYTTKAIDVKQYNIGTIVQIFRTENPSRVSDFTDIYSMSTINIANTSSANLLLSDYLYRTQITQIKSTITTDLDFTFDAPAQKLYINTYYPTPRYVTLAYIPDFRDASEVRDQFWINYIQRLSLANAKETLGRVRGKYDLSSSLYKLDGNQLIAEGIAERDSVRQELNENSDIVFPMD